MGSGAGIDCFIAAKKLGRHGRVIGIDMTDEMIEKARISAKKVAEVLGYDYNIVEFKKGDLMDLSHKALNQNVVDENGFSQTLLIYSCEKEVI